MDPSPAAVVAAHAARRELAYQLDADGRAQWPPRYGPFAWAVSAGRGTVYATTTVHRQGEPAYDVTLIDLDEGFRIMSRVVTAPGPADGAAWGVGTRVLIAWDGELPVFEVER